ncbi:MAG: ArsC/Spx/MgsR family protein [Cyanobacteria bacterium P01_E01_bin.42]
MNIIFYEKPGCINNTKQKALLAAAGHQVEAKSLLTEPWSGDRLRSFFGDRPISEWFNPSAPRIKSGEVIPAQLDETTALTLMIEDPLLIRRPLLEVGETREVGFDRDRIQAWLGLTPQNPKEDLENCPRSHG